MSLANDYAKTLQGRVGTPPFMTYDLLKGTDVLHLYRHKVESLFCIMVILIAHYKIEASVNRKQSVGTGARREEKRNRRTRSGSVNKYGDLSNFK